ncbi:protein ACTIVITY OF BC1 COMPLEX KINASE 7, chloroplastic-like [Rhododendron vialii]|uniref:protein ACTIVITY OF BC1 COMPLEX KINASE 7, chloroplastic-like n=1 Tax=Rhododendron vialii TaxID=182163 RepID=UPI00265DDA72|nr:protein ACTIVITY OF BC1 COMPLEX KINASE 7, chloroplastic-like [Rhododendron vialii]
MNHGRSVHHLSLSSSISIQQLPTFGRHTCKSNPTDRFFRFQVKMQQSELPAKLGSNGRTTKMVPTSEVKKRKTPSLDNVDVVNGSKRVVNGSNGVVNGSIGVANGSKGVLNGSKVVVNGASIVKRDIASALVKTKKTGGSKALPPIEELKVLPSDDGFSWASENYNSVQRSIDVWSFVLSLHVRVLFDNAKWSYIGGFTEDKQKNRRRRIASWLRECVVQLGLTFIKLGQLSSTRPDLFPREFVDELAKLQDRLAAFLPKKVKAFIANELGAPVDILFKEFEVQPIAAASLGQVGARCTYIIYEAFGVVTLTSFTLSKDQSLSTFCYHFLFYMDLKHIGNLKLIAEYFQRSETLGGPTRDWIGIYEECAKILYEEIDYINEGKNADRFRRDFRNVKWVQVPLVIWDYTVTKVLTLEYVPGIKINRTDMLDARGYSRSQIALRSMEAYLIQILITGFFHADPHPGNLAIDVDESLIYYNFGMMGEIKSFTRQRLLDLFYAVYEKDAKKVMGSLIDLEALQPTGDLSSVRRSGQFFLDNLLSQSPDQQQTLAAIGERRKRVVPWLEPFDVAYDTTRVPPHRTQNLGVMTPQGCHPTELRTWALKFGQDDIIVIGNSTKGFLSKLPPRHVVRNPSIAFTRSGYKISLTLTNPSAFSRYPSLSLSASLQHFSGQLGFHCLLHEVSACELGRSVFFSPFDRSCHCFRIHMEFSAMIYVPCVRFCCCRAPSDLIIPVFACGVVTQHVFTVDCDSCTVFVYQIFSIYYTACGDATFSNHNMILTSEA